MIITYNNGNQIKKADSYESEEKSDTLILGIYDPKESKYKTEESKYDAFNQLIEVKGSVNAEYKYRPDGLRLSKTADGNKTEFVWNGSQILAEKGKGGTNVYSYGISRINSSKNKSVNHYYVYNGHGDVVQLTGNGSGKNLLKTYEYDAYGNEESKDGNDTNPFRYCGEYFDNETDNIYLRARYYNPRAGRFITEDPVKDGLNWYGYCGGNPVAFVDPSGLRISMFKSDVKKVYRKEQRDIRLEELQKLTNDELYIDEKTEFVKYKNIAVEMTKPKGTLLIRELIDSSELIRVIQDPNGGNEADDKYTNDGLNLLDNVEVNINPENEIQFMSKDYFTERLSEPICPKYIILGHELIHAYRRINNIPEIFIEGKYNTYRENDVTGVGYVTYKERDKIEELETIGINYVNTKTGKYVEASRFRYTENALRREHKIGPRIRY